MRNATEMKAARIDEPIIVAYVATIRDHAVKGLITVSPQVSSKPGRPVEICQRGYLCKSNGIKLQGDGIGPEAARIARDTSQFLVKPNRIARCHDDIADRGAFEVKLTPQRSLPAQPRRDQ